MIEDGKMTMMIMIMLLLLLEDKFFGVEICDLGRVGGSFSRLCGLCLVWFVCLVFYERGF